MHGSVTVLAGTVADGLRRININTRQIARLALLLISRVAGWINQSTAVGGCSGKSIEFTR